MNIERKIIFPFFAFACVMAAIEFVPGNPVWLIVTVAVIAILYMSTGKRGGGRGGRIHRG
jgi:hypothetical protein